MVKVKITTMYRRGVLTYALAAKLPTLEEVRTFLRAKLSLPRRVYLIGDALHDQEAHNCVKVAGFYPVYNLWRFPVVREGRSYRMESSVYHLQRYQGFLTTEGQQTPGFQDYRNLNRLLVKECAGRESRDFDVNGTDPSFDYLTDTVVVLYTKAGQPVGYAAYKIEDETLYVWTTYVRPEHRASRAFSLLIAFLFKRAEAEGCTVVEASTDPTEINPLNEVFRKRGGLHVSTTYAEA